MKNYYKIGETFEHEGKILECVEDPNCNCETVEGLTCKIKLASRECWLMPCSQKGRPDHKNVCFIEKTEKQIKNKNLAGKQ